MFDGLDEAERRSLFELLGRLKRHLNDGGGGRPR